MVASPVLAAIYHLGHKGKDLTMPVKFTLGMFLCALGFLTAAAAGMWFADARVNLAVVYCAGLSVPESGELLISALGLAMVAALVPQHLMGFILGMWFLTQPPLSCWAAMWRPYRGAGKHHRPAADPAGLHQCVQ